ncbi:hypothetical protein BH20ACT9_BH20ACT9_18730 [soil metagenome]
MDTDVDGPGERFRGPDAWRSPLEGLDRLERLAEDLPAWSRA